MHSPELKRESIRNGKSYEAALRALNTRYQEGQHERMNAVMAKKLEEMKRAHSERVEEERRRGEAKKARRRKEPFINKEMKENNRVLL